MKDKTAWILITFCLIIGAIGFTRAFDSITQNTTETPVSQVTETPVVQDPIKLPSAPADDEDDEDEDEEDDDN